LHLARCSTTPRRRYLLARPRGGEGALHPWGASESSPRKPMPWRI
jgi:hypothetical protein